ncbi:MAG: dihydrodipicolinate synthase family protein [Alphaproteobacteria bacterium]|nr:dihydrodipicolinate synthase family protein [Alphaproteobacteria bacterium]
MSKLKGVFPVLPTPFDAKGAVDTASLLRLLEFAVESGADGFVYPGMASEVETLTSAERAAAVTALGKALRGRIKFVVGASAADPDEAAARAREGAEAGASAAMIMAPAKAGQDVAAHIAFYAQVAKNCPIPIMLQNAPAPNGAGLKPEAVVQVALAVPTVRYVKEETLPCGQHVTKILAAAGGKLDGVFGGAGARYLIDELVRGAAGTMPATEMADVHVDIVRAFETGDTKKARYLYSRTLPLLLFQQTFRVRMTKTVLQARGLVGSNASRAAGPVPDAGDNVELAALIAEAADLFNRHPVREAAQ